MLKQQRYINMAQNIRWQQLELIRNKMPARLRAPMQVKGSLTQFIQAHTKQSMQVCVLSEAWQLPLPYERRALKLAMRKVVWVRQVLLRIDNQDWVYARSVVPMSTLQGQWKILQHLHTRPLGSLLFKRKKTRRGVIKVGHASRATHKDVLSWARYSSFSKQQNNAFKIMLVSEYFLDDFMRNYWSNSHA